MASIRKLTTGRWQAQIARNGIRKSKLFDSKRAASDRAAREEYLILSAKPTGQTMLLSEVFNLYANEVSPTRRGERWEIIRLRRFGRDPLAAKTIAAITGKDIAEWRDKRLQEVAPASVRCEMELMSAVFTVARVDWGLI